MAAATVSTIGVDLGLTYARAAWLQDGVPVLLETLSGQRALPAVVGLDRHGALHVGESARNQHLLWPERTASRLRRLLGTSQRVFLADKSFSSHELCAVVLAQLKENVEQRLGHPITGLVLALPAPFTQTQRHAAADAAALAGFRSVKLVLEPLAIAAAYGLTPQALTPEQPILIYDVGGRSSEVAILQSDGAGDSATWVIRASAGSAIGGEICDQRVAAHLSHLFEREHGLSPFTSRKAQARLRLLAEWAKCELSRADSTTLRLPGLMSSIHGPVDLQAELSREQLELLIEDDLKKGLDAIEIALRDARLPASQLHAVLLSGGGALLPLLGRLVSELLVIRPLRGISPEQAIACGAALLSVR
jgi:molecular chaperone DnaK